MDSRIAEVTQRIIERSKDSRKAYLEKKLNTHAAKVLTAVYFRAET